MRESAEEIVRFWLEDVGPEGWYAPSAGLDDEIRTRFKDLWERARVGAQDDWTCAPRSCLALLILLDQFPRNMFRAEGMAFATDARALAVAKGAIARGLDARVGTSERQFFFLPLMHSEIGADQSRSVARYCMAFGRCDYTTHAIAHRAVIRQFGRFPYRNEVLGRNSTAEERAFLAAGGYRAALDAARDA